MNLQVLVPSSLRVSQQLCWVTWKRIYLEASPTCQDVRILFASNAYFKTLNLGFDLETHG